MEIIATASTEDAASALGVRPPTIRRLIREGRLKATRIGKSWRIGVNSINELLAGTIPAHASHEMEKPVTMQHHIIEPEIQKTNSSPYSDSDLAWIQRYRQALTDPDPEIRTQAKWQLEQFSRRAEEDPTRRPPTMTPEQYRKAAEAIKADWCSKGSGSNTLW